GLRGTQMKFGHDEKGEPLQYTVTVFVTEKKIYVVEFGGTKAQLDRLDAQMKWVIESFQAG
ncbi:MAG TPA: serine/threonine protein kinase, partial [Polyangiaceae bacterium]|nr:serine/threonine protein kinase [Polyangiaceae bacterium]